MPNISELITQALHWIEPYYLSYGYGLVFLGAMLEHTFFLAWALPGGVLVALGGLYAQNGQLSLPLVILLAALGFTLGDHLDFIVGRRSTHLLARVTRGRTARVSPAGGIRSVLALLVAYTNTVPRATMFMGGAASGLRYRRFLLLSLGCALVWSSVFSLLGYVLGRNRERLTSVLQAIGVGGQIAIATIALGLLAYWYLQRRKRQRAAAHA
ncbi:MAG: hypothetical protein M3281_09725 [Chloroflexota bacterium]|nr:hypothetical protein [Chloroflexota bacterium]